MICIHCGANNPDTVVICRNCGKPARMTQQEAFSSRFPPSQPQQQATQPPPWQSPQQAVPPSWQTPQQVTQTSTWQSPRNSIPSAPLAPSFPGKQPVRTQTARSASSRSWLLIGIISIVLLVLVVGSVVFFLNHSFTASSNPTSQTLTTYCNALKSGDYQTAYAQLASGMKNQLKEPDFAYSWQSKNVSSCTVDTSSANAASCTDTSCAGSITFFFKDGSSTTDQYQLMQENGQWKIQSQSSGS
jgi:hypothetical protein